MNKPVKILGKRGRVTIPYEIRQALGFTDNDILSFTAQPDGTLLVRREKLCDDSEEKQEPAEKRTSDSVMELLDSLPDSQQREILIQLSVRWAEKENGEIEVSFTFGGMLITKDIELVVFETLYREGNEIAVHADINDTDQTIIIRPVLVPPPDVPKTGDNTPVSLWIGLAAAVREVIEDLPVQAMLRKPSKTHGHRQKHRSRRSLIMLCSLLWI